MGYDNHTATAYKHYKTWLWNDVDISPTQKRPAEAPDES